MARHTDAADVDPTRMNDDQLVEYINSVAPVAAGLPDGEYGEEVLTANAEAAIDEFRSRNGIDGDDETSHLTGDDRDPSDAEVAFGETVDDFEDAVADAVATDGGRDPIVDATPDDHYLRDVDDHESEFKKRHTRAVRTRVDDDGRVIHTIFETVGDDVDDASIRWSRPYFGSCPACDADVDIDRTTGDQYVEDFECSAGCGWSLRRAATGPTNPHTDDVDGRPLWSKKTVPHDFENDTDVDASDFVNDEYDITDASNLVRTLYLDVRQKALGTFADDAYVSAERDDDGDVVEPSHISTFECGSCGDVRETPAKRTHAHFGDVCPACEDATVWSIDDADLPDDVEARMSEHKTFNPTKIRSLLRDVMYWSNYVAASNDDTDPEDVGPIQTGAGGKIGVVAGSGRPGTGLRRPKGFAHDFAHFRTVLRDAVDTGLITRADDADTDVDDENAAWEATDKGRDVFDQIARCTTCGSRLVPARRVSSYTSGGGYSQKDASLTTTCPSCDKSSSRDTGALVLESSTGDTAYLPLPGVTVDE